MPPSFPSTQSRLVECGLDARTAETGGAGVLCDPGALPDRVKVDDTKKGVTRRESCLVAQMDDYRKKGNLRLT